MEGFWINVFRSDHASLNISGYEFKLYDKYLHFLKINYEMGI